MRKLLFFFFFISIHTSFSQTKIDGKVVDQNSEDLPGVSVSVLGTSIGTISDSNGNYSITVPDGSSSIVYSFIGYTSLTEEIRGRKVINVTLLEESNQLNEVVVNALGFKSKKDRAGATSTSITSGAIKTSGEQGILNSLAGKASGVKIARANGDPGAGTNIQIRGANTIFGSSQPLVIVDGVPISNDNLYGNGSRGGGVSQQSRLNDLNPEDIENIQVLKGASAAALWGSRAANGVLMITTKSGLLNQKMKVSLSSTYSVDEINRRHPLQTTWGQGSGGVYSPTSSNSWGDKISERAGGNDEVDDTGRYFLGDDGRTYYPIKTKNSTENFVDSNFDKVFQSGHYLDNTVTIQGGGAKTTNFFSLGYLDQIGIIKGQYYDRLTLRFNNQTFFNKVINLSTKANYIYSDANRTQQSSTTAGLYLGLLRNPPDFDISTYKGTYVDANKIAYPGRQRSYRRYLGDNINPTYNNPIWTALEQRSTTKVNRFNASSNLNINPLEWLQLDFRGGVDTYIDQREYFFPVGTAGRANGSLENEQYVNTEVNLDAIARIEFPDIIENKIGANATIGYNINDRNRTFISALSEKFLVNSDLGTFTNGVSPFSISNNLRHIRSNRLYSVFAFDFFDQLFLNVSGTQEAASTIKGSYFYPSADLAWQFTNLPNLKSDFFSFGKFRLAYGKVGVQPQPYRFSTTYEKFTYSSYDDLLSINEFGGGLRVNDDKGNPDLKPEIKTEFEIGADLRFFKDNLTLGVTYYHNKINDILFAVGLSPSSGYLSKYDNAGTMQNKGLEVDFSYQILKKDNLGLQLYGNFNNNKNEVLDLSGAASVPLTTQSISSNVVVGKSLGALYASKAARNDDGSLALTEYGFPYLANEQGFVGDPNPDWRGGLGLRTNYKNFNLNVLFETSQGGAFAERTRFVLNSFGTYSDTENEVTLTRDMTNVKGVVYKAGSVVRGNIKDFGAGDVLLDQAWYTSLGGGFGGSAINEFSIADGSWTRLREVSLGYSLNGPKFKEKTKLNSIDFSVIGRNLVLWTKVLGIDPEVNQSGVDNGFGIEYFTNPSTRSWVFSVKINY